MIEETARVIEAKQGDVWVETQRRSACGQCAVNNSCGTALLSRFLGVKRTKVRIVNPESIPLAVGDEVIIGIAENALTRGSLAIYTVPLIGLFIFAFIGELLAERLSIANEDLISIGFGVLGLFAGFWWVKRFSRKISKHPGYQPVLIRKIEQKFGRSVPIRFQS